MTTTALTPTGEPTEREWAYLDRLVEVLEAAPDRGVTPSRAGVALGVPPADAKRLLGWLVGQQNAHTSGNGAWTRYHAGRAR